MGALTAMEAAKEGLRTIGKATVSSGIRVKRVKADKGDTK